MTNLALIENASLLWLMATGLLLGSLHALEPGHAKTMIAAFVVATRGSVPQAVLLGLSAAVSHSVLIWLLAAAALYFGNSFIGDEAEPWLQLGSGIAIIGIGLTMAWRLSAQWNDHGNHDHDHRHGHDHAHHEHHHPHDHHHDHDHPQDHDHAPHGLAAHGNDAHAIVHARQIQRRIAGRAVTNGQIMMFGLSSGLIPCPAALTLLLVCLRLKKIILGVGLVTAFSIGLAVTLVMLGVVASLGMSRAVRHLPGFERVAEAAPYLSCALVIVVGVFMGVTGFLHLPAGA